MSWLKAVGALLALGGCATLPALPSPEEAEAIGAALESDAVWTAYQRQFEIEYTEPPFAGGALALMASEGGEYRTWTLVPCQGGTAICAGGPAGPAGRLLRTPDYLVVDGLYDRRFWLSWGGDGWVERHGAYVPLAWDARANGEGEGYDPVVETPARHH